MPAPTKTRVVRASALLVAIGVNVLFVALLVSGRARLTPEPIAAAMIWIALEPREPQHRPTRDRRRVPPDRMKQAPAERQAAEVAIQPVAAPQSAPEDPRMPLVDWAMEGQRSAEQFAANYGKPHAFSPPPITDLAAKLCAPRIPGAALQAKMDELLPPPPPEPTLPPAWPPPGSVVLAGNVIVQFIQFSAPVGKKPSRGVQSRNPDRRSESSVPDPNTCD